MNWYGYCGGNPLSRIDQSGLENVDGGSGKMTSEPTYYYIKELNDFEYKDVKNISDFFYNVVAVVDNAGVGVVNSGINLLNDIFGFVQSIFHKETGKYIKNTASEFKKIPKALYAVLKDFFTTPLGKSFKQFITQFKYAKTWEFILEIAIEGYIGTKAMNAVKTKAPTDVL